MQASYSLKLKSVKNVKRKILRDVSFRPNRLELNNATSKDKRRKT